MFIGAFFIYLLVLNIIKMEPNSWKLSEIGFFQIVICDWGKCDAFKMNQFNTSIFSSLREIESTEQLWCHTIQKVHPKLMIRCDLFFNGKTLKIQLAFTLYNVHVYCAVCTEEWVRADRSLYKYYMLSSCTIKMATSDLNPIRCISDCFLSYQHHDLLTLRR